MSSLEHPERPDGLPPERRGADHAGPGQPWSAWWALLIGFGAFVFATLAYVLVATLHDAIVEAPVHRDGTFGVALHGAPPVLSFVSTLAQDAVLIVGSLLAAGSALGGKVSADRFGLRPPARPWSAAAFVGGGYLGFLLLAAAWLTVLGYKEQENIPIQLGTRDSAAALALGTLLTCVVAPLAEEIFFRGFLFGALRKHGLIVAALVSGIAFGLVHVASAPIGFIVPLAALGVILALLYEWTGSLYVPIALHALNNAIAFGAGDGRAWLIPVGLALAAVAVLSVDRVVRGHRPWRTVVPTP